MNRIAIYEGYGYRKRRKSRSTHKRRKGGASRQRAKFKAAAKACKGKSIGAFRACMRKKLRK